MRELRLEVLNQRVSFSTDDAEIADVLLDVFGAFKTDFREVPDLSLGAGRQGAGFRVRTGCGAVRDCPTLSDLVYVVDKDLTVEVQLRRPDLLFVHAAVLRCGPDAVMLAGDSGSGKSTTAWGLTRLGFAFMSDELAPIDPRTRVVEPYPRALGLKRVPAGLELPPNARRLERTIHVPVAELGVPCVAGRAPLAKVFFVRHDPQAQAARVVALSPAETAARLYVLSLNALAHPAAGLDAVARVAAGVRGYLLTTAGWVESGNALPALLESA